jgi:hypothetical protein
MRQARVAGRTSSRYDEPVHARAPALALALALAACALFPSFDGFTGGAPASGDSGVPNDVSDDRAAQATDGSGTDGGRERWCERGAAASFCDDFDGSILGAGWDETTQSLGTLALTPVATSAPNALLVSMPAAVSGDSGCHLTKFFARAASSFLLEFDFRSEQRPGDQLVIATVSLQGNYRFDLALYGWEATLFERDPAGDRHVYPFATLPAGSWRRIGVAIVLTDPATVTIRYGAPDDPALPIVVDQKPLTPAASSGTALLRVGAAFNRAPSPEQRLFFDNLRFDAR